MPFFELLRDGKSSRVIATDREKALKYLGDRFGIELTINGSGETEYTMRELDTEGRTKATWSGPVYLVQDPCG